MLPTSIWHFVSCLSVKAVPLDSISAAFACHNVYVELQALLAYIYICVTDYMLTGTYHHIKAIVPNG